MSEFYNESVKSKFLMRYGVGSQKIFARIFRFSQSLEEEYGTDMSNFTLEQVEAVLKKLKPATEASSRNSTSCIFTYINWAIEEGLSSLPVNPLSNKPLDWCRSFIVPITELSESKFNSLERNCVNAQDAVILRLIFEGVKGDGCAELLQLSIHDVDFERGVLTLTNQDQSIRYLEVSQQALYLIKLAARETLYQKKNGSFSGTTKNPHTRLVENEYVIRSSITRNENVHAADKFLIYRRLSMLSEVFQLPKLNVNMIERSGMMKMAKDLLEAEGKLEREQYFKIAERFNIAKRINNGIEEYNYYPLRSFLNEKAVRELYNL
ncbi:hypothetical protein [Paenibacillus elgii]|uniref:phage lytic cycle repressor MrpR family protein n=1 Tax=Paenibacillus elgii TaxID=189691 RepID=UPI0013D4F9B7|nr:hypothetical protein [Paenibacillus elgii]NEN84480.1 hypothetical protein [Paenibacillus elgii]